MNQLRDATGRPGPATWELRAYPAGQDDYPGRRHQLVRGRGVCGVRGHELPTVTTGARRRRTACLSSIAAYSNFRQRTGAGRGLPGHRSVGTYDMAGNVREWCTNVAGTRRYILGGAWNQPNYLFNQPDAIDPFDRAAINGVRTITRASATPVAEPLLRPIVTLARDYTRETPVSDKDFENIRRQYAYDRDDLKATVESRDDSHELWRVERGELRRGVRRRADRWLLFLPKKGAAPYQTVIVFPGSSAIGPAPIAAGARHVCGQERPRSGVSGLPWHVRATGWTHLDVARLQPSLSASTS